MTTGEQLNNISTVTNVPAWLHLMNPITTYYITADITSLSEKDAIMLTEIPTTSISEVASRSISEVLIESLSEETTETLNGSCNG